MTEPSNTEQEDNRPLSERSIVSLKRQRKQLERRKNILQGKIDALDMEIKERDPYD